MIDRQEEERRRGTKQEEKKQNFHIMLLEAFYVVIHGVIWAVRDEVKWSLIFRYLRQNFVKHNPSNAWGQISKILSNSMQKIKPNKRNQ